MTRRAPGKGTITKAGYIVRRIDGIQRLEHLFVAEKALGKPLPIGSEVHHVDENKANNDPSNLVICPDSAYHKLIHARMRARDACGNADWIKCRLCKEYDHPSALVQHGQTRSNIYHAACNAQRSRDIRATKKDAL